MSLQYAIIGTGGIGGYYGGRLAEHGHDVHFLLHSDYPYVKQHGLQVDSCNGSFHLDHPAIYAASEDMPTADVVLVCLKTTQNHLLSSLLAPLLTPDTVVVLIQNGIGVEDDAQQMLPNAQLVAGLAFICTAKTAPGHIHHQCYGQLNLGNFSCRDTARLQQIADDLNASAIPTALVEYHTARWRKAVWNMPFNGMTVAYQAQTDQLLQQPDTRLLIRQQMEEVVRTACHLGVSGLDDLFIEKMLHMTDKMTPYSPSMKLDYDHRRPMEIYYLYTRPLQIARAAGCPMTHLEQLEQRLLALQATY